MSPQLTPEGTEHAAYWDALTGRYQQETRISLTEFHYGPLLPGDSRLGLLPHPLEGRACLELGCGGAQNSLVLARSGARCTAVDVSPAMLAYAEQLAVQESLDVVLLQADLDCLPAFGGERFDLIHSAYGLPFASNPEAVIRTCATLLNPGGVMLFSLGHPVTAGEWLELDDDRGLFLTQYLHPAPDVREGETATAMSRRYPLGEPVEWLHRAGLRLDRLLEPAALPEAQLHEAPYTSPEWEAQAGELRRFPLVAVYRAHKPT